MGVDEIYPLVEQIILRLAKDGLAEWSTRLDDSMRGGFTSGEILMAVRWNLQQLKKSRLPLTPELLYQIDLALQYIGQTGI